MMNAHAKIIAKSKLSEWKGLDRIPPVVHGMGCIWREQEKDDIGIDGEIELCRPRLDGDGLIGTGKIVKAQSKSGSSYIIRDDDCSFASPVSEKDLLYWRGLNLPVIYIVYHPDDDTLYWKDVKAYLKARPDFSPPHRIEFDKKKDRFDHTAYPALCELCETAPERVSLELGEPLYTNLLQVVRMPERVWVAPVLPQKQPRFHDRLTGIIPPYVFKAGVVVTLTDPTEHDTALTSVVDAGGVEDHGLEDWLSRGPESENDLRRLMNSLLHRHLRELGLSYQKHPRRYFFNRGLAEDSPLSRRWTSARTGRSQPRLVAKHYEYGRLKFFRHQAVTANFEQFGGKWSIALHPALHYTLDGSKPWETDAAKSFAIRARAEEYNNVYLNNVLFWSYQLARGEQTFDLKVGEVAIARVSGVPLTVDAAFSIQTSPPPGRKRA
jgi:hypothetical protein